MHVPTDGWMNGSWNVKLPQFRSLAEMLGHTEASLSLGAVQDLVRRAGTAKVFAENIQPFLDATGYDRKEAIRRLEKIEQKLGLMEPLPFMSMKGVLAPWEFDGVAIWPMGTTNWSKLRLEQIQTAQAAGARFNRIVCLHSSRVCNGAADRKHPLIAGLPEGQEPTEKGLQRALVFSGGHDTSLYHFVELPDVNDQGRPLSLEQQLQHMQTSGQYDELIGGADIYVPSTPNSLYVPLHVRRVLGHDNVWFSQAGARLVRTPSENWWPSLQDVMTTPSGLLRLWSELIQAGCMNG